MLHRLPDMGEADDPVFPQRADALFAGAYGFGVYQLYYKGMVREPCEQSCLLFALEAKAMEQTFPQAS